MNGSLDNFHHFGFPLSLQFINVLLLLCLLSMVSQSANWLYVDVWSLTLYQKKDIASNEQSVNLPGS